MLTYRNTKRGLDLLIAGLALLVASPLMLAIAVAIRITMGAPVLFRQTRPGFGERPFTIYKFRTMICETERAGRLLSDGERIGRLGRLLRTTSCDELPELWNVIRGEMSLVGPRPLLMRYLPYYTAEEHRRHTVLPGITGWAQIHGRNELPFDERLVLDVWYVDHCSLGLDLRILLRTVAIVIARTGYRDESRSLDNIREPAGIGAGLTSHPATPP
jgi:lipopolysaccharide/colanic/teichoic acid biosynthesis glycosyltransferase